jgi:hypothetical protein
MYLAQMGSIVSDTFKIEGRWASPETQEQIRAATCAAVARMLAGQLITVGAVSEGGFVPWAFGIEETVQRIDSEWKRLGRISLGDICWCEATSLGKETGRNLLATIGSSLERD